MKISTHALHRYRERVANIDEEEIIAALSGRAFDAAEQMNADVILPSGHRVVVRDGVAVTVLPVPAHKRKRGHK